MPTIEARTSTKGISYRVRIRVDGAPPITRTFTRHAAARAWAMETEAAVRDGKFAAGSGHVLADAVDGFLASALAEKKDKRNLRARALWWRQKLGRTRLRDLTAHHVADCLEGLTATPQAAKKHNGERRPRSAATVNRYRAAISAVLSWAERQSPPWVSGNVARKTLHRAEAHGRTRFLSAEERVALLAEAKRSASADLYLAVVLSLATGARQSEVLGLRWPDVDLGRGMVSFHDTKNGDSRSVPLPADVVALLSERRKVVRLGADLVFASAKDAQKPVDLRASFRAVMRRAGIVGFRWHDLRHSAASAFADTGASLLDIGTLLGHRSQQTTRRYAHLTDSRLRDLVERAAVKHRVA